MSRNPHNRDDFLIAIKHKLALRVAHRCSIPGCGAITVGPSATSTSAVNNVGMASHICGAASGQGSVRFEAAMTPEQRAAIDNGIWTCRTCGTKIDNDVETYSADRLRAWKVQAEARALQLIGTNGALTDAERRDAIVAKAYSDIPLMFLVRFRAAALFLHKWRGLSAKARTAFGVPADLNSLAPHLIYMAMRLPDGDYRGQYPVDDENRCEFLGIDRSVLDEILGAESDSLAAGVTGPNGNPISILDWACVLATDVQKPVEQLLQRYAASASPWLIDLVETIRNKVELIESVHRPPRSPRSIAHTKTFVVELIGLLVTLYLRFNELRRICGDLPAGALPMAVEAGT